MTRDTAQMGGKQRKGLFSATIAPNAGILGKKLENYCE